MSQDVRLYVPIDTFKEGRRGEKEEWEVSVRCIKL